MSSKKKVKYRNVPYVLEFHVPNQQTQHRQYAQYMIFMYQSFRSEHYLKSGNLLTRANKLRESNVIELANQNHFQIEANETIVKDVSERFDSEFETNTDPFRQQKNDEKYDH